MGRNGTYMGLMGRRIDGAGGGWMVNEDGFDGIMGREFKGCGGGKDYNVSKVGKVFKEGIGNGWEE